MPKLSNDLKRVLSSLASQDAGEYLPMCDKMKALGFEPATRAAPSSPHRNVAKKAATHRIAFISDGRGSGAPLDYVIDACQRHDAKIDLLTHGAINTQSLSRLENQLCATGVDYHRIQLGENPVEGTLDYIHNQPALIFLVAVPDDSTAEILMKEVIPEQGRRIPVPLVLIEDRPSASLTDQSAA